MSEDHRPNPNELLAQMKCEQTTNARAILSFSDSRAASSNLLARRKRLGLVAIMLGAALFVGCYKEGGTVLERTSQARQLAGELRVGLTQAAGASNLAVMATTDEASKAFARDAGEKTRHLQTTADALQLVLIDLRFTKELKLLSQFEQHFANYRQLNREILDLSIENTNLKAQHLSFSQVHEAAEAFRRAAEALALSNSAEQRVLVLSAVAAIREIEVLEGPHIAEATDAAMTRIEGKMRESEERARQSLRTLIEQMPEGRASVSSAAEGALEQFFAVHAQVIALSRRNSNVRSLVLSLGQQRVLAAKCEDDLRALGEALDKRGFVATR